MLEYLLIYNFHLFYVGKIKIPNNFSYARRHLFFNLKDKILGLIAMKRAGALGSCPTLTPALPYAVASLGFAKP